MMKMTVGLAVFAAFAAWGVPAQEISSADAANHVGETATVCGSVTGVHQATGSRSRPTFLNFGHKYPNQDFTVLIWESDLPKFGNLERFVGKTVCATGALIDYRNKPEMIVRSQGSLAVR